MPNKPRRKSRKSFTVTQVGVLVEDLHSRMDVFADGQKALQEKVDLVWETQGRTMERVTMVEVRLTRVETRLTHVENRLTGVEGRLTGVEGRLTGVEGTQRKMLTALERHDIRLS